MYFNIILLVLTKMDSKISENILKSNTSIVGIVCKDGVVMAADRRSTAGGGGMGIVMNKKSQKIRRMNDYTLASSTGGVSDIELTIKVAAAELRLKELKTKIRPTIKEAANLMAMMTYRSIRTPSMIPSIVGTLIGGFNEDGSFELYTIEPAGSVLKVEDYDANFSSGMPYILGLLESEYNKDIDVKEGTELARKCIKSAIERDTGSGNGIDVFAITKSGIKHVVSEELVPQFK